MGAIVNVPKSKLPPTDWLKPGARSAPLVLPRVRKIDLILAIKNTALLLANCCSKVDVEVFVYPFNLLAVFQVSPDRDNSQELWGSRPLARIFNHYRLEPFKIQRGTPQAEIEELLGILLWVALQNAKSD